MDEDEHSGISEIRARATKVRRINDTAPDLQRPISRSHVEATFDEKRLMEQRARQKAIDNMPAAPRAAPTLRPQEQGLAKAFPPRTKETRNPMSAARSEERPPPARDRATGPVYVGAPPSALDSLAIEIENIFGAFRVSWKHAVGGDRLALFSFVGIVAGALMPWVSMGSNRYELGIFSGGVIHLLIALKTLNIVIKSGVSFQKDVTLRSRRFRRGAAYLVLLGLLSTLVGIFFLLYFSLQRSPENPVIVHFGLYWTLVFGCVLSYAGFLRFRKGQQAQ